MYEYEKTIRIEIKKFKSRGLITTWSVFTLVLIILMLYEGRYGASISERIIIPDANIYYYNIEAELCMIFGLSLPVLASIIASKLVDEESLHNTWILLSCANQKITKLCDVKILITYLLIELTSFIVFCISILQLYFLSKLTIPVDKLALAFFCISMVNIIITVTVFSTALYSQNQILTIIVGLLLGIIGVVSPLMSPSVAQFIPYTYYAFCMLSGQRIIGVDQSGLTRWEYYAIEPRLGLITFVSIIFVVIYFLVRYNFSRRER